MKKLIYAFLILSMFAPRFFAQVISATNFPIGGMDISTLFPLSIDPTIIRDSMSKIGLNTYYLQDSYQISGGNKYGIAGSLYSNMTMYSGTSYYQGNLLNGSYCGAKGKYPGTELRYFLATTPIQMLSTPYGIKSDYERLDLHIKQSGGNSAWADLPKGAPDVGSPAEWKIPTRDGSNNLLTGNLLDLELDNNIQPFQDGGNTNLIVDFIFRFGSEAIGTTTTLYTITVTVFNSNGTTASTTTLPLTESVYTPMRSITYANYGSISNNPNQPFGNPTSLYYFPNNPPLHLNDPSYAIVRIGGGTIDIGGKNKVVITLTRFVDGTNDNTTVPIWVRGFRLRTQMADDILANNTVSGNPMKTNIQTNLFSPLINDLQQSQAVWSHTSNINGSTEPTRECFRVLSYLDYLLSNYTNTAGNMNSGFKAKKMNLYSFLTENVSNAYAEYRAIYEDEIGVVPPIIDAEGTFATYEKRDIRSDLSVPVPPFMPRDAILSSIRGISGFTDLGFTVRPFLPSNPSFPESQSNAYSAYTNAWQGQVGITDGGSDLFGFFTFTSSTHEDAARSAIPDPTWPASEKTKWYAMVTSMSNTIWNLGTIMKPLDEPSVSSQTDLTSFRNTIGNIFIDNATSTTNPNGITPGVDIFHSGFDISHIILPGALSTNIYNDHTNGRIWQWGRSPLAAEMRADAWDALAWGAKGIIFNAFGSGGGANVGICDKALRGDYDFGTESTKDGLFDQTIGDCTTPFFTADPNASNAHNYTDRTIKYAGSSTLPSSGGKRLSAYQRVPITLGTGSPWERVTQSNLDDFIAGSTSMTLNHNEGTATGSNWGTNPQQAMPSGFTNPGDWVPSLGGCPNIGIFTSNGNFSSGETIKIGANTYNLVTSLTTTPAPIPGEVIVDNAHQDVTISNIAACIMNSGGGNYTPWGTGEDQDVKVDANDAHSLTIELKLSTGTAFSVVTASTCAHAKWSENTLNVWESFFSGYPRDDNGTAMPYNCTAGLWYYFPQPYFRMLASVPTFYGFKERWNGARQIVTDLSHCANTLKDLNWINTYSLPKITLSANGVISGVTLTAGGSGYISCTCSVF